MEPIIESIKNSASWENSEGQNLMAVEIQAGTMVIYSISLWLLKLTWVNHLEVRLAHGEKVTKKLQRRAVSTEPNCSIIIPKLLDSSTVFQVIGFYSCVTNTRRQEDEAWWKTTRLLVGCMGVHAKNMDGFES